METAHPPRACSSSEASGKSCWSLDARVMIILVVVAGAVIVVLLYRLLQTRHRLRMASARHALEYYSFYHTATYTFKHPSSYEKLQNGSVPRTVAPVQTVALATPVVTAPLPPLPVPLSASMPLPPAPVHPSVPSLHMTPPVLTPPLPVVHTAAPSPHLSWGACSDVDVYSCIGAYRPSRLSSLSSNSKVILFEHSSL
ncbi:uncharacterized protein LOC130905718 isoform X2 [Corythoichthys intestinalis]|nr:uncharacterized protein LOC130905718 isoform X2 [Corythoichthys intestinalis]XP_057675328.1 uncharacterized protein LOC130905718 isoform X2 [Corythoichthys intestinalis]XP_057675329.1 uncharacterized protein LOC130905718 isoform X2 [Corythoichthys intestinalis]XP_057675330.1 uncharacterized protein LOC130905718 isoform X2 [Corythoichthys intestinalis]XP_057675331.1 uncharacterized protein LOC130905718 isoform X2 [Corythoichthys intestinalis]